MAILTEQPQNLEVGPSETAGAQKPYMSGGIFVTVSRTMDDTFIKLLKILTFKDNSLLK